jgi:hypothetical protein
LALFFQASGTLSITLSGKPGVTTAFPSGIYQVFYFNGYSHPFLIPWLGFFIQDEIFIFLKNQKDR